MMASWSAFFHVFSPSPANMAFEGIAQVGQVMPQIAAWGVAGSQFLNQIRILEAPLPQILSGFRMVVELQLVKGGGLRE